MGGCTELGNAVIVQISLNIAEVAGLTMGGLFMVVLILCVTLSNVRMHCWIDAQNRAGASGSSVSEVSGDGDQQAEAAAASAKAAEEGEGAEVAAVRDVHTRTCKLQL